MSQTSVIAGILTLGFIIFVVVRGDVSIYQEILFGTLSNPPMVPVNQPNLPAIGLGANGGGV